MKDKEHPMIALFKRFKETVSCNMLNFQHINHADFWAKQARQTHTSELLEDCQTWLSLAHENNQKLMQRAEKAEAELAALKLENQELREALGMLNDEFKGLPHSLGYCYTHTGKVDALLERIKQQENGK